jgi:hypothetical protein
MVVTFAQFDGDPFEIDSDNCKFHVIRFAF